MERLRQFPGAKGLDSVAKLAMTLAILSLPVTSLPLLSRLMGGTMVAPPTVIFVFILVVIWLPAYFLRLGQIPREILPFLAFLVAALAAAALAFFLPIFPYKGHTVISEEVGAILTLAIGAGTYLIFALWFQNQEHFTWALRILNYSGLVILLWSAALVIVPFLTGGEYPPVMVRLNQLLSSQSPDEYIMFSGYPRFAGFAFEPSWLAHQLNMVFIPAWLAASSTGFSAHKKIGWLTLEKVLFAGGVVVLFMTFSRVGLLGFFIMVAFFFYHTNLRFVRWLKPRLLGTRLQKSTWVEVVFVVISFLVYGVAILGIMKLMAEFDWRVGQWFTLTEIPTNVFALASQVKVLERLLFWDCGWQVFGRFPLLGVGLGNAGFFFEDYLHNIGTGTYETIRLLNFSDLVPNIKSMWVRLLAETGMIGFGLFATWMFLLWKAARWLRGHASPVLRTLGWMGAFSMLAFLAEGFSIDSFALPYLWVSLGLLTAASFLARRQEFETK
ncbi:MAG: hypothetical protein JXB85_05900 [Anaerolineales bacterium]|nr:hypothetical protein [Anaerolineales bacterium]